MKPVITAPLGISWALIWTPWCRLKKEEKENQPWIGMAMGLAFKEGLPCLFFSFSILESTIQLMAKLHLVISYLLYKSFCRLYELLNRRVMPNIPLPEALALSYLCINCSITYQSHMSSTSFIYITGAPNPNKRDNYERLLGLLQVPGGIMDHSARKLDNLECKTNKLSHCDVYLEQRPEGCPDFNKGEY
ncbi:hypothetical protein CsSME_00032678 [Camellia sinensis var. sinensis]